MKWIPYALAAVALMGCDLKEILEDDTGTDTTPDVTDTATEPTDDTGAASWSRPRRARSRPPGPRP